MRESFPGYYQPTDDEFKDLWDHCFFSFDANVLLDIYDYPDPARSELLRLFRILSDRIWMTHQAVREYHRNRLRIISRQIKNYDRSIKRLKDQQKQIADDLESAVHPYIPNAEQYVSDLSIIVSKILETLKSEKDTYSNYKKEDPILDSLSSIFEDRIGFAFDDGALTEILSLADKRNQLRIPPGFEDQADKDGIYKYGDYFIWRQLIDHSKNEKIPLIFVTAEKKVDWWRKVDGEIISPRPELIEEFLDKCGQSCYIYNIAQFMKFANKYLKKNVKNDAINKIKDVIQKKRTRKEIGEYFIPKNSLLGLAQSLQSGASLASSGFREAISSQQNFSRLAAEALASSGFQEAISSQQNLTRLAAEALVQPSHEDLGKTKVPDKPKTRKNKKA